MKNNDQMNVLVSFDGAQVAEILAFASEASSGNIPLSFDESLKMLINTALSLSKQNDLNDKEIDEIVDRLVNFALENCDLNTAFKVNELYIKATGRRWTTISSTSRKTIGRRFRSKAGQYADEADIDERILKFTGRNINNAALYEVVTNDI